MVVGPAAGGANGYPFVGQIRLLAGVSPRRCGAGFQRCCLFLQARRSPLAGELVKEEAGAELPVGRDCALAACFCMIRVILQCW